MTLRTDPNLASPRTDKVLPRLEIPETVSRPDTTVEPDTETAETVAVEAETEEETTSFWNSAVAATVEPVTERPKPTLTGPITDKDCLHIIESTEVTPRRTDGPLTDKPEPINPHPVTERVLH